MTRALVVRLDNLGDVVMLGPALRALADGLPEASITLLASPAGASVASMLPWVDDVIEHRAVWQDASGRSPLGPGNELALVDELRRRHFDVAAISTSFSQSPWPPAMTCFLAGIPVRAGIAPDFGGGLLTAAVPPPPDGTHQVDRSLAVVGGLGVPADDHRLELVVPAGAADRALRAIGIGPSEAFVALSPGASCATRRYDPVRFAEVGRRVAAASELPLVVVGTEGEAEAAAPATAAGARSLVGLTSVVELAAVIGRASLLVTGNSGPMHLADALGTPQVVAFAGTEAESEWAPRTSPAVLLRRPTTCAPCRLFRCPYDHECLDLDPAAVAAAALSLLSPGVAA